MSHGGIVTRLINFTNKLVGFIRGGLSISGVCAHGLFGAISGSDLAAIASISNFMMPALEKKKYPREFSIGLMTSSPLLAIIIPPSIPMVIYGVVTQTSIGQLLVAGVIPGILLGILLTLCILLWVTISPSHAPKTSRVPWADRWRSLRNIWPSLLLILIVLVLLYSGVATPTEVGAVGAFMAALIGVAMKRLTWRGALHALRETIRTSTMIFLIMIGANIFGYFMTMSRVPNHIVEAVMAMNLNRWTIVIGIIVVYFFISMVMDEIPLLLITLPLTFPLITSVGFDPVWFGVLSVMMVCMGLVFPPVGMIAFVVSATANVDLLKVYRGTSILIIAIFIATALVMIFPEIALWLPATMRG